MTEAAAAEVAAGPAAAAGPQAAAAEVAAGPEASAAAAAPEVAGGEPPAGAGAGGASSSSLELISTRATPGCCGAEPQSLQQALAAGQSFQPQPAAVQCQSQGVLAKSYLCRDSP